MYQDRFVVAIKNNGRVLREHGDTTYLPFGCEYSILLKNKNSVRALVSVEIDGKDATGGIQLIVPANGQVDLKRFIEDGNFEKGHKFKFIERTKKIEDGPRGIIAEDGLIRVEFEFEQEQKKILHEQHVYHTYDHYPWYRTHLWNGPYMGSVSGSLLSTTATRGAVGSASYSANSANSAGLTGVSGDTVTASASGSETISGSISGVNAFHSATMDSCAVPQNASYDPTSIQEDFYFSQSKGAGSKVESLPANDVGITVAGGVSDQKFVTGAWFPTDGVKHVMVMKLLGQVGEKKVKEAITVKTKQECPTCGTTNKFGTKFCKECGTGLSII